MLVFGLHAAGGSRLAKSTSENALSFLLRIPKIIPPPTDPVEIFKWCLALSIAIAASRWAVNLLLSPFFWMYFCWTWLFWPWMAAIAVAIYGVYSLTRHLKGEVTMLEQLAVVTSTFTLPTLVPPAHFNGFLEGWPFVFFFIYHHISGALDYACHLLRHAPSCRLHVQRGTLC